MKKLLMMLLACTLVLSLCACEKNEEAKTEEVSSEVVSESKEEAAAPEKGETWTKASDDEISGRDAFASTTTEFETKFEEMIDASEYDIKKDAEEIYYELKYDNKVDYNFDYEVKFYDGLNVTLPTTYETMKKNGWSTEMEESEQISNKVQTGVEFTNSNGESIMLWTQNLDDSKDEKTISLKNCDLYAIDLTMFSGDEKNNIPDFSLCNGITQSSDIADVVEKLGKPANARYSVKYDKITLSYREKLDEWYSSIIFEFDPAGNYMRNAKYEYSYADIK